MGLFKLSCLLLLLGSLTLLASCSGDPGNKSPVNNPPLPASPQNVTAAPGDGQATVSWDFVTDATSYNLYIATQTGVTASNYSSLADGTAYTDVPNPYSLTGLTSGQTYYIVATAVNADGESIESAEVSATILTWAYHQIGSQATYFRNIFFADNSTGWIVGAIQEPVSTTSPVPIAYKTVDGGSNWTKIFQDAQYGYTLGLHFVDNNNGWISIAGMSSPNRIYATTDGGSTWDWKFTPAFGVKDISALDVNNAFAVGGSSSVLHTTDGFQTCETLYIGDILWQAWNIEIVSPSTGYIASVDDKKVFKTINGGATWSHVHTGIESFIAMDFVDENTGWVGGHLMDLWHTRDGGATWVKQTVPSTLETIAGISFIDSFSGWLTTSTLSGNGGEIWRTVDGGQNWTLAFEDNTTDFNHIHVNDFSHGWVSTRSGGVVRLQ